MTSVRLAIFSATAAVTLALAAFAASAAALPPLNDPPGSEYRQGKFVWIDLVTADLPAAEKFYGALFGWTFTRVGDDPVRYTLAWQAGYPVAGLAARAPTPGPTTAEVRKAWWVAYMSVPDVDRAAADVVAKGGKILIPARVLEGRGRMALLADPDGAPFGLLRSASGDPPDFRAEPGDWIWAVYQSADAGRAAAFYQDLGNYEVVPGDPVGGAASYTLQAEGFARAVLLEIPPDRIELRPEWIYFVRVADVATSAAKAVELGGRVIVAPRPDLEDGRLGVVTDPDGALLGLMEWDDDGEGN
jgi:predicted enzyme related to lactoylglutathione lyase